MTLYITIERDRGARSSNAGARFRVRVHAAQGSPALLVSARDLPSVIKAKAEAELLFGELDWQEGAGDVRMSALLEFD